jgi:tetratricopeptide (TPR) repeat protein
LLLVTVLGVALTSVACGQAAPTPVPVAPTGPTIRTSTHVITPTDDATEKELLERGQRALMEQRWRAAVDAFEILLGAEPTDKAMVATATFGLGLAYQGLGDYAKARAQLEKRLALTDAGAESRLARARLLAVLAYLEDWPALGALGEKMLARADLEPMDKMNALGARALGKIEGADDEHAGRDLQLGLDVMEEQHFGTGGRLLGPAAQLKFVEGEIRRVREEKIAFVTGDAPPRLADDFLARMNARCQGLLDAQSSYADAMRSEDPFWATISGFRLGQAYRALHKDLMAIPPTDKAKSEKDKQLFFGIMHVRYRVLLEKGTDMIKRTYDFAVKNGDMAWVTRTLQSKKDMELSVEEEKAVIARMPFTEADLQGALDLMEKHYRDKEAAKKR